MYLYINILPFNSCFMNMNFKKPPFLLEYDIKGAIMNLNNLGFNFSKLSACTVKRKNLIGSLVMYILAACFLPMVIVFIILYLTKSPIEINNVMVNFGEPAYNAFFYPFVGAFLFLSILFLALAIYFSVGKTKVYMIIDRDKTTYNKLYYIYNRKKKEEIYLTEKFAIAYSYKYNNTYHETDPKKVKDLLNSFIFWYDFPNIEDATVKHRKNSTVVKIKLFSHSRYSMSRIKRFVFTSRINVVPETVLEYVGYGRAGSANYQEINKYYFENVNRSQKVNIHPEIKKILHGLV